MAKSPIKIVRFLVWLSAERGNKEDQLTAFDEGFEHTYEEFGWAWAHWWSISQALRSMPYNVIANLIRIGVLIAGIVT